MRTPGTVENEVLIGRHGHLFLAGGAHSVLDYVSGKLRTPDSSYRHFESNVRMRAAYVESKGIPYRHIIYPDKQSVLLEAFPFAEPICLGEMYLDRCSHISAHMLYPRELLRHHVGECFLHTDTHLSDFGGLIVASEIAKTLLESDLSREVADLRDRVAHMRSHCGDLGSKLSPPVSAMERYIAYGWDQRLISNRLTRNDGIVDIWLSPRALTSKRLLIFGDSFGRDLARVISYFFRQTIFLRTPFFYPELVEQIHPDCVITENVERYLTYVRGDDDRPCFFMYPFLTAKPLMYTPDPNFGEVFSAMLSYPRRPYQAFVARYIEQHVAEAGESLQLPKRRPTQPTISPED